MPQRSGSELTRVAHAWGGGSKPQVNRGASLPLTAGPATPILQADDDRPKKEFNMTRTRYVSWVIAGLCVLGMSSPLFATCTNDLDCNDEIQCTLDLCSGGSCVHIPVDAPCVDEFFCNGVETCDAVAGCLPGTNPCLPLACAEATDLCTCVSDANCDDGLFCTGVETCVNGQCVDGTPLDCDDGFSCTDDSCNEQTNQCDNAPDDSACADGDFCNGDEVCAPATGDPVTGCEDGVSPCDDGDGCTVDTCDEVDDTCSSMPDCSDGVECTVDSCNTQTNECEHAPDDQFCIDADGQFCNGDETCDPVSGCQSPGFRSCDDGLFCTFELCDPFLNACDFFVDCFDGIACTVNACTSSGCVFTPDDSACDDNIFCNGVETCDVNAGCLAGPDPCDDGVACTVDTCDEVQGCTHTPDDAACDDNRTCTQDVCDTVAGCLYTPDHGSCNNGLNCDGTEVCQPLGGDPVTGCASGTPLCNDAIFCTVDSCTEPGICLFSPDDNACDDAIICTLDSCDAGLGCQFTPVHAGCDNGAFCDGAELCAPATGDPVTGCEDGPLPCDDGDNCTADLCDDISDTCSNPPDCSDGIDCTVDSCNEQANQCEHAPDDQFCIDADGQFCNGDETCDPIAGCQAAVPAFHDCNDGLSCTFELCDPVLNVCDFFVDCFDGIACTTNACTASGCVFTPDDSACDDSVSCTLDICDDVTGCDHIPVNAACPDDGLFCNGPEICDPPAGCVSGPAPCAAPACNEMTDTCAGCSDNTDCPGFKPFCCVGVCRRCCTNSDCDFPATCSSGFCVEEVEFHLP